MSVCEGWWDESSESDGWFRDPESEWKREKVHERGNKEEWSGSRNSGGEGKRGRRVKEIERDKLVS